MRLPWWRHAGEAIIVSHSGSRLVATCRSRSPPAAIISSRLSMVRRAVEIAPAVLGGIAQRDPDRAAVSPVRSASAQPGARPDCDRRGGLARFQRQRSPGPCRMVRPRAARWHLGHAMIRPLSVAARSSTSEMSRVAAQVPGLGRPHDEPILPTIRRKECVG